MDVPLNQGYYDHVRVERDEERRRRVISPRAAWIGRVLWLAASLLAGILLVGLFVWIWIGPLHSP